MSFANPTPLRLGMIGELDGQRYRIAGRVVMAMDEDGETYYWNEFNLVSGDGNSATLVFEETDRGYEWRLFTMFEPEYPITAADAATKRIGDRLNLDGTDVRVTLVDESRVHYIDGEAPEGVELNDVAQYFNAESGNTMQVVSWSGDEVECYHGENLNHRRVAGAFNLPVTSFASSASGFSTSELLGGGEGSTGTVVKAVVAAMAVVMLIVAYRGFHLPARRNSLVKLNATPSPVTLGSSGTLSGTMFTVFTHSVVEVAEVGKLFDRHEYFLTNDNGVTAILIGGSQASGRDWSLFRPLLPLDPLTPQQAAAIQWGQTVNVDGIIAPASEIFCATIGDSVSTDPQVEHRGELFFGFSGRAGSVLLLVRWNAKGIQFYRGEALSEKAIVAAFGRPQSR